MLSVAAEKLVLHDAVPVAAFKATMLMDLEGMMSRSESVDLFPFASVIGSKLLGDLRMLASWSKYLKYFWILLRFLDLSNSRRTFASNRFSWMLDVAG
jgi:hypothetical protein